MRPPLRHLYRRNATGTAAMRSLWIAFGTTAITGGTPGDVPHKQLIQPALQRILRYRQTPCDELNTQGVLPCVVELIRKPSGWGKPCTYGKIHNKKILHAWRRSGNSRVSIRLTQYSHVQVYLLQVGALSTLLIWSSASHFTHVRCFNLCFCSHSLSNIICRRPNDGREPKQLLPELPKSWRYFGWVVTSDHRSLKCSHRQTSSGNTFIPNFMELRKITKTLLREGRDAMIPQDRISKIRKIV
jgi:hypothetical protein